MRGIVWLCVAMLWLVPDPGLAQEVADEMDNDVSPSIVGYTGLSIGYSRTWWGLSKYDEGYANAGTAGPRIELRLVRPMGSRTSLVPYVQYMWMNSTVSYLVCDTCYGQVRTERNMFREIDLGFHVQYSVTASGRGLYFGAGPSIRWGQSGSRDTDAERGGLDRKGTWFGWTFLAGLRTGWGENAVAYVEPQFTFSPDLADRWQHAYPPANLNLMMGILW